MCDGNGIRGYANEDLQVVVVPEGPAARFSERVLEPWADVPVLMLTHIIPAPKSDADEQALIGEVREGGYRGQVTVARDLDRRVLGTGTPTPRPAFRSARDSVRLYSEVQFISSLR